MTTSAQEPNLRRAVLLMTGSSFLVPLAGLVTAPILARGLSTDGRGELAAALAPGALMLAAATLGLPDALTYFLAKNPGWTRPALIWSSVVTLALGAVCLVVVYAVIPFLAAGDDQLARLIVLSTALTVPSLVVNVLRGAATGHQMWTAVALERLANTVLRVGAFAVLFATGDLTVLTALVVTCLTTVAPALVYLPLLAARRSPTTGTGVTADQRGVTLQRSIMAPIVSFGSRLWLGSVASMLLNRVASLLVAPLSSVADLGLYAVATTVSDVPLVVALGVQGAVFGVNSMRRDAAQVTSTARLTLLVAAAGSLVLGATLPWSLTFLFGTEFRGALGPTIIMLFSAVLCVPGLAAATALGAWERPGMRSVGLIVTLLANIPLLVVLVPLFGVYGAAWTSLGSNVVMTTFMVVVARRAMHVRGSDFWLIRPDDVRRAWHEGSRISRRLLPRFV